MHLLEFKLSFELCLDISSVKQMVVEKNIDVDLLIFEALSDQGDHGLVPIIVSLGANIDADKGFAYTAREYGMRRGYNWDSLKLTEEYQCSDSEGCVTDGFDSGLLCDSHVQSQGDF